MQDAARGGTGGRLALAVLSAAVIAAVLVSWDRYEAAGPDGPRDEAHAAVPIAASPGAEAQEHSPRSAALAPARRERPPDIATRVRGEDRPHDPGALRDPQPTPEPVLHGTGAFLVAGGESDVVGDGPVRRFLVEVEDGTRLDPEAVAEEIEAILFDERGWTADPRHAFQRVDEGPVDFRVTLASPDTVDRECRPLRTVGRFSCWNGARAMLNLWRWLEGAEAYGDDVEAYRRYLVSHEVGHALGYGHVRCPGDGQQAPTMMQQSISVGSCAPNPWPHPND